MRSLKLYRVVTDEDPYLEVMRGTREQKQEDWRRGTEKRARLEQGQRQEPG
jgi:hypothetical protein